MHLELETIEHTGEKLPAYKSRLFLTNISITAPTKFACSAIGNDEDVTKIYQQEISFKIIGMKASVLGKMGNSNLLISTDCRWLRPDCCRPKKCDRQQNIFV